MALDPKAAQVPRATYRLQLNRDFTFRDATALVPYLAKLGVSHVYCSPYFRARPGSTHGYDVVAHDEINPEIGTREDLERFAEALRAQGMGQVLDIVPNHVGIMGRDNARWMDVLENGRASASAEFFDIEWQGLNRLIPARLVVPVLGDHYGRVLERGELELRFERDQGSLAVHYYEHRFPIDPREYPRVLARALEPLRSGEIAGVDAPTLAAFESLVTAFGHLPSREEVAPEQLTERNRDKEVHKRRLAELCSGASALGAAVERAVGAFRGDPADPRSFDALDELLEAQAYRLASWRVASDEINYRRFFDVNDLAALRMENEPVFEATHALAFELLERGIVHGLRIDHPDGLYDPQQYFERLQSRGPVYVVIEKIAAPFEKLPEAWPVAGTTGYGFANLVNGLFVDASARSRIDRNYRNFLQGDAPEWEDVAFESKRLVLRSSLAAELHVLARQLLRIAAADRRTRDFSLASLREALGDVIGCFPVYRTYLRAGAPTEQDRRYIDWAIAQAKRRTRIADVSIFDFIRSALLLEALAEQPPPGPALVQAFARKFQQVSSPVTAKGVEDTAFYRFNRLVSLNDVGGDPHIFGTSVRAFHADGRQRARSCPHGMLAGSTHDSKRSEDVRARIDVITELPAGVWRGTLTRWSRMNRTRKREVDGAPAPSPRDEYLLYQTLLGSFPLEPPDDAALADYRERIERYMQKATREAKLSTSWINPNEAYEEAVAQFVRALLERRDSNLFLNDLATQAAHLARFGLLNSLSQTLLRLTSPGVPDIYRGTELFEFSLVDPDNRRPVDFAHRAQMLDELLEWHGAGRESFADRARMLLERPGDGRAKLHLISRTLAFRKAHEALFRDGDYLALPANGEAGAHVCAFARRHGESFAIVLAPRLCLRLLEDREALPLGREVWRDTAIELPAGLASLIGEEALEGWLDGAEVRLEHGAGASVIRVGDALAGFPVAMLVRRSPVPG